MTSQEVLSQHATILGSAVKAMNKVVSQSPDAVAPVLEIMTVTVETSVRAARYLHRTPSTLRLALNYLRVVNEDLRKIRVLMDLALRPGEEMEKIDKLIDITNLPPLSTANQAEKDEEWNSRLQKLLR